MQSALLIDKASDALLSTSLVVAAVAALSSNETFYSAVHSLLVGLLQLLRVGLVVWCRSRLRRSEIAVAAEGLKEAKLAALEACLPAPEEAWCHAQEAQPVQEEVTREVSDAEPEPLRKLRLQCEETLRSLLDTRQELASAGAREARLREALRSRSAALLRLASHLTKAREREPDQIRPNQGEASCARLDAEVQTVQTPKSAQTVQTEVSEAKVEPATASPAAQLKELANSSPELRQLVLRRLRSATGVGETPCESSPQATPDARSDEALAQKCAEQAAEAERWRRSCQDKASQAQALTQQVMQMTAKLQEQDAALKAKDIELEQYRNEAKQVFSFEPESPELRLRWAEDCQPLPGEPGSAKGARQLKQSLAGRTRGPADLRVGPPPADWRVLLQLRLKAAEPWEPALLQLSVPDAEVSSFLGLLWPVLS